MILFFVTCFFLKAHNGHSYFPGVKSGGVLTYLSKQECAALMGRFFTRNPSILVPFKKINKNKNSLNMGQIFWLSPPPFKPNLSTPRVLCSCCLTVLRRTSTWWPLTFDLPHLCNLIHVSISGITKPCLKLLA